MAHQTNLGFALITMGQWCRSHGIHEVRDVLRQALELAAGAESSELLAEALEEAGFAVEAASRDLTEPAIDAPAEPVAEVAADAPVDAPADAVEQQQESEPAAADSGDASARKGKRISS